MWISRVTHVRSLNVGKYRHNYKGFSEKFTYLMFIKNFVENIQLFGDGIDITRTASRTLSMNVYTLFNLYRVIRLSVLCSYHYSYH